MAMRVAQKVFFSFAPEKELTNPHPNALPWKACKKCAP
jgi:hypothetical protein